MKQQYTPLQALEDIAVSFDESSYEPTIIGVECDRHFIDIWREQFDIIKNALERLEKIDKLVEEKQTVYVKEVK